MRNANLVLRVAERRKPKGNVDFSWLLHSRTLTLLNAVTDLNVLNVDTYYKIRAISVGRASVL